MRDLYNTFLGSVLACCRHDGNEARHERTEASDPAAGDDRHEPSSHDASVIYHDIGNFS